MERARHTDWDTDDFAEDYDALIGDEEDDESSLPALSPEVNGPGSKYVAQAETTAGEEKQVSDEERLDALLDSMDTRRKVLLGIIAMCREPVESSQLMNAVNELQAHNQSVFASSTLCELLAKAGGLRHVNADGSDFEAEQDENEPPAEVTAPEAPGVTTQIAGTSDARTGTITGAEIIGAEVNDGTHGPDDEEPFELEYLEVKRPTESYWQATPVGLAAITADDPRSRLEQLLASDACYLPVYREIIEALADAPLTKMQIDAIVNSHPLTQDHRVRAGYFIDRLEHADAIEWTSPWTLTELGRDILHDKILYQ